MCNPVPQLNLESDVTLTERKDSSADVKNKFSDIFSVNNDCDRFPVDLDNFRDDVNVKGRLQRPSSIKFFESIGASDYVLKVLKEGHYPKLNGPVPDYHFRNNASYFKHKEFADKEILSLLAKNRVEIVKDKPKCVNPLSVAVQRTKLRFILDCSHLNTFMNVPHIKYEGFETALNYFKKGTFMYSFDLKDGYHHISIHPDFKTYLGFSICLNGVTTYFQYTVGCFGLADLPRLFTKIYRPLVSHWRSISIPGIMFLDDGGFFETDRQSAVQHSDHVRKDILRSGSVYSIKKSDFTPTQKMTWLGIEWNSENGTISAASHRVEKIKLTCQTLINKDVCPVKKLASFVGQIISLSSVVGNCARIVTKVSQFSIANCVSWDENVILSGEIKREILFWNDNIDKLNIRLISGESTPKVLQVIEGDASATGCGSILNREAVAARIFSEDERLTHSTYRELANIHFSLLAFLPKIKHENIKFLVDSQSAARIIQNGSMKPDLQFFAKEVFHLCFVNNIKLNIEWIPREENKLADAASREADLIDIEDWGITKSFFKILNHSYGPFSLDAFANFYNAKVTKFFSMFHCPGSSGVDAFLQDWHGENVLLVPPVNVIGRALSYLRCCRAKGTLIAPKWPSSYFWPLLMNDFHHFIVDIKILKGKNVLCHGLNKNSLLGASYFNGDVIAVALDCN